MEQNATAVAGHRTVAQPEVPDPCPPVLQIHVATDRLMLKRGFTLIEVLVVTMVVAVLLGIALPVMAGAKRRALESVDIANLKSIGVAMALYQEEWNDSAPTLDKMTQARYLPISIVVSPLDRSARGQANEVMSISGRAVTLHRTSYLSLADFTETQVEKLLLTRGAGTVVSIATCDYLIPSEGVKGGFTGRYLRLLKDGSVQSRQVKWAGSSEEDLGTSYLWLFTDETESFPIEPTS